MIIYKFKQIKNISFILEITIILKCSEFNYFNSEIKYNFLTLKKKINKMKIKQKK